MRRFIGMAIPTQWDWVQDQFMNACSTQDVFHRVTLFSQTTIVHVSWRELFIETRKFHTHTHTHKPDKSASSILRLQTSSSFPNSLDLRVANFSLLLFYSTSESQNTSKTHQTNEIIRMFTKLTLLFPLVTHTSTFI